MTVKLVARSGVSRSGIAAPERPAAAASRGQGAGFGIRSSPVLSALCPDPGFRRRPAGKHDRADMPVPAMPGTHKLWEGYLILSLFVENHRAMRDYANVESTVYH